LVLGTKKAVKQVKDVKQDGPIKEVKASWRTEMAGGISPPVERTNDSE
jgi:hypothetical protein